MRQRVLWWVAVAFFAVGIVLMASPARAAEGGGETTFSWGQVCVLVAVAAGWGDMRAQLRDVRRDVADIKREQHEQRGE